MYMYEYAYYYVLCFYHGTGTCILLNLEYGYVYWHKGLFILYNKYQS